MRKILLSALVIISFFMYAFLVRAKSVAQTPVIAQNTIGKRISITPTATPVPLTPTPTVKIQQSTTILLQPTSTPQPTVVPTATPKPQGQFKDGTYTGSVADAFYGPIQAQVTVSGGRISSVQLVQSPNDRPESIQINEQAGPMLAQEAIQAQSANVDVVSGATDTSNAFVQSMQAALSQAKS
jgi:uncharacterized protein with FMN-binding domain